MMASRFLAFLMGIGLILLQGCSSEENLPKNSSKDSVTQQSTNDTKAPANSNADVTSESDHQGPVSPSRSELRVMAEETKATEEQAKSVIEQFDMNLNNREQRIVAEDKFKKMLPEYKEKMLQLGKAQLQHEK